MNDEKEKIKKAIIQAKANVELEGEIQNKNFLKEYSKEKLQDKKTKRIINTKKGENTNGTK